MSKCLKEYGVLISQMLDGELSEKEKERLLNHLKECETCREEYEKFNRIEELIKAYPKEELSNEFSDRFKKNIHSYISKGTSKQKFSRRPLSYITAIAAAIIIMFVLNFLRSSFQTGDEFENVASVVGSIGHINRQTSDGKWFDVHPYSVIKNGDIIKTGSESFLKLELSNNNEIAVEENSILKLEKILRQDLNYRLKLEEGEMEANVRNLTGKFIVETSYGNIEVLGTIFKAKMKEGKLYIRVEEGSVQFISKKEKFIIEQGKILIYSPNSYSFREIKTTQNQTSPVISEQPEEAFTNKRDSEKDYSNILVFNNIPVYFPKDDFNIDDFNIDLSKYKYFKAKKQDIENIYDRVLDGELSSNINRSGLIFYKNERDRYIIISIYKFKTLEDRINWWDNITPIEEPVRSVKETGENFGFWTFKSYGNVNLFCYRDNWIYTISIEKDPEANHNDDNFRMEKLRDYILKSIVKNVRK